MCKHQGGVIRKDEKDNILLIKVCCIKLVCFMNLNFKKCQFCAYEITPTFIALSSMA